MGDPPHPIHGLRASENRDARSLPASRCAATGIRQPRPQQPPVGSVELTDHRPLSGGVVLPVAQQQEAQAPEFLGGLRPAAAPRGSTRAGGPRRVRRWPSRPRGRCRGTPWLRARSAAPVGSPPRRRRSRTPAWPPALLPGRRRTRALPPWCGPWPPTRPCKWTGRRRPSGSGPFLYLTSSTAIATKAVAGG